MTAYKMNSNPAFHCLALAVMLALSVQAEDEIQGPTIKGVALEEEAVLLDVDFSNPFVWEEIQFKSIKTCLLYTSPSPRDGLLSRMPSSA